MGMLEDVANMSGQGFTEEEIVMNLKEKGISPKEIKDTLNQLKIKNAVSNYEAESEENSPQDQAGGYPPQEQGNYYPPGQNYPSPQQEYAPQENYGNYPQQTGVDANTIIEISEQVFSEKIKIIQKEIDSFNEFKSLNQIRIENLNDRLKRMEMVFDKLQITILEKIGSYGQNLEVIKKEMNMMQDSFTKVIDPMVDKGEKRQEEKRTHHSPIKKSSKIK